MFFFRYVNCHFLRVRPPSKSILCMAEEPFSSGIADDNFHQISFQFLYNGLGVSQEHQFPVAITSSRHPFPRSNSDPFRRLSALIRLYHVYFIHQYTPTCLLLSTIWILTEYDFGKCSTRTYSPLHFHQNEACSSVHEAKPPAGLVCGNFIGWWDKCGNYLSSMDVCTILQYQINITPQS